MWSLRKLPRRSSVENSGSQSLKSDYVLYYQIRMHTDSSKNQLGELDLAEAMTDFDMATGVGLIGLGLARVYSAPLAVGWADVLVCGGLILLVAAYYEFQASRAVLNILSVDLKAKRG